MYCIRSKKIDRKIVVQNREGNIDLKLFEELYTEIL